MAKWILFSKDTCVTIQTNEKYLYENMQFKPKQDFLYINNKIRIKKGDSIRIDDWHILFPKEIDTWHIYLLKKEQIIGRNQKADLHIHNDWISNEHARIYQENKNWYLKDLNSTNGTYLNGKSVSKVRLKIQDHIQMANLEMYFFETFILINTKINVCDCQPEANHKELSLDLTVHDQEIKTSNTIMKMDIQGPVIEEKPEKTDLVQAIGSSCLILLSSSGVALTSIMMNAFNKEQIKTMLMTSGSMFVAFFIYGLWNRNNQYRTACEKWKTSKDVYEQYLQKMRTDLWKKREEYLSKEYEIEAICTDCKDIYYGYKHPLWIGHGPKHWIEIELPNIGYEQQASSFVKKMYEMVEEVCQPIIRNEYLQEKETGWLAAKNVLCIHDLFLQWLWQGFSDAYKWVWNIPEIDCHHSYMGLTCCQENGKRLHIKDVQGIESIQSVWNPKHHYVIVTNDRAMKKHFSGNCTWIIVSEKKKADEKEIRMPHREVMRTQWRKVSKREQRKEEKHFFSTLGMNDLHQFQCSMWYTQKKVCLEVPIGFNSEGKIVKLDFKKQGPHGLVAGTTGSGKSEWLSSILMQLVIRNHPQFMQYILIDFKGGAFGQAFYDFPHCAGMVTNLEDRAIDRWLLSLQTELRKRQKAFQDLIQKNHDGIANIDSYNAHAEIPMSHLFIIVDEFASIKEQYPQQMQEMKELARIGRSLGIHLILCTQKPMGIIDEQIWANAQWKVCLRVNSESDSREILRNEQGAYLEKAGSFICDDGTKQFKARGFYLRETVLSNKENHWCEVNEKDETIRQKTRETKTVLQVLTKIIQTEQLDHNWIVHPDLAQSTNWHNVLLKIDLPQEQRQMDYVIHSGEKCIIYSIDHQKTVSFVQTCVSLFQKEIYTIGFDDMEPYVDQCIPAGIYPSFQTGTVIIQAKEMDGWQFYLENKRLRVIVCVNFCNHSLQQMLQTFHHRLALSWQDLDAIRYYFGIFSIPRINNNYGLLLWKKDLRYFYYQDKKPKPLQRRKKRIQTAQTYLIGIDTQSHQMVAWSHKGALLICYVQKSVEDRIAILLQNWHEKDPLLVISDTFDVNADIYVMHVIHQSDCFQNDFYKENQYDFQVLWVGMGFQEYGYILNRKMPFDFIGSMIYWEEQKVWTMDWNA